MRWWRLLAASIAVASPISSASAPLPAAVARKLPQGYKVMATAEARPDRANVFVMVVLAAKTERRGWGKTDAPPRPLLVFKLTRTGYRQVVRNDAVVLRANEGGQCDPFENGEIAVTGLYVSIEHNVACGQHWTSIITFRFDPRVGGYVFDNVRYQSWKWNPDQRPDAEALVVDIDHVERAKGRVIPLSRWHRRD
jgi:hypothetical protein